MCTIMYLVATFLGDINAPFDLLIDPVVGNVTSLFDV